MRHYNFLIKEQTNNTEALDIKEQEKAFKNNFHKFAKETTNGTYNKTKVGPTFTQDVANTFYKEKYSTEVAIDIEKLSWFPEVTEPSIPYNLTPYNSHNIYETLKKKSANSSPGDDDIIYDYLKKLKSVHRFLSTLFTQIRDSSEAPAIWGSSRIILLSKDENNEHTDDPTTFRMISLTANVGKLYHSMESSRTIDFMIKNKYLDPSAQKAYIEGINGCVEHIQVIQEVIQHAKANHKTVHISWFDLVDAFGSLSHMLIPHVMNHYHLPREISNYIQNMYSKLQGRVKTHHWETDVFKFLKGAFQGDPFSGTIFLIAFNPLIEYISKYKETHGYTINETNETDKTQTNIITTPFADDFNLITKNETLHQKLTTEIEEKASTMGFLFKPSKCRSLSICLGSPKDVTFVLSNSNQSDQCVPIETVYTRPHKFLGSIITYTNTPKEYFKHFYEVLEKKLTNIDNSKVRGEHKLAIYERHALPSMRYHLSVHDMHNSHLDELDNLAKKYIKSWLNFPTRGVTDGGIFHPYLLKVKQPSQVYLEGHAGNLTLMTLKGDKTVQACIKSKLARESKWKRKSSTIVKSNSIIAQLVTRNKIIIPVSGNTTTRNIKSAKLAVKRSIQDTIKDKWNDKVRNLTMQGDFAQLLIEEQESVTWQSVIRKMPRNVMAFAARLSTNSLASPDNLARWGKRKMGTCPLCSYRSGTLAHITNICPVALRQGRFTWRHDSILQHISLTLKGLVTNNIEIYADLPGLQVNGTTLPADIIVSSGEGSKPDLVLVDRFKKEIALLELTSPLPRNTFNANTAKLTKYTQLDIDLSDKGYKVYLVPFEVCSNGHITKQNKGNIENVLKKFNIKIKPKILTDLSQISLLCTMSVFHAYQTSEWVSPPLLSP
jgi:hypothetical protein